MRAVRVRPNRRCTPHDGPAAQGRSPPPIDFTDRARARERSLFALYQVIDQGLEESAMQMALDHAGLQPEDVDYINAHATSTGLGDISETYAIKNVFGNKAQSVAISATKSMTGHLLGGAGAVEMAACALSIRDSVIPPTINLENPDAECDLDYTANEARERKVRVALNNSFGFGGHNATLVACAFEN